MTKGSVDSETGYHAVPILRDIAVWALRSSQRILRGASRARFQQTMRGNVLLCLQRPLFACSDKDELEVYGVLELSHQVLASAVSNNSDHKDTA
jgi:hypothetical protein